MRVLAALALLTGTAVAEPLPPGSIGLWASAVSGTGADASRIGQGWQWGGAAAWQPMNTEQRIGWTAKTSFSFGRMYNASAASVDQLLTLQMDAEVGLRVRPGIDTSRYIAVRLGAELLRANQIVPPYLQRAFAGAVASIGLEKYAYGFLFDATVRVSQIGSGPTSIALMIGASKTGP